MKNSLPMNNFLRWCPGALGFLLRQKLYPRLFNHCGRNVLFGRYLNVKLPEKIHIGDNVVLGDYVTLDATLSTDTEPGISIGKGVFIGSGTILQAAPHSIIIESNSSLSTQCIIKSTQPVHIGQNVLVAAYTTVGKATGQNSTDTCNGKTEIQSGCWLGARAIINEGVRIGRDSVIGAHGIVTTDLPERVVTVGQPVKIIAKRQTSGIQRV